MPETKEVDRSALIAEWEKANSALIEGMRWTPEVQLRSKVRGPEASELWGGALPDGVSVTCDTAALLSAIRLAGYLAISGAEFVGVPIEAARANILLDRSVVVDDEAAEMPDYMREGGIWLAFGHASLVDLDEPLRDGYPSPEALGASYGGLVQSDTEASRVTVTGDSIWAPQYSPPNVIDGVAETFWASIEAGPMPHWVQLDFAKPRTVARAEVSCRPGFLLKDLEVQAKVGEEWQTCAMVTDNNEWVIDCPFEAATESAAFRLFIKREEMNGENRVIADVGEFTLLDEQGARLIAPPYLIEGSITDPAWAKANRSDRLVLRSPAVRLKPTTAKVLATFDDPLTGEPLPLCTVNQVGKGRAYLFAVPEGALGYAPETWEALLRAFVGMPMVRHSGDTGVLAYLRRGKGRAILHVLDTMPPDQPDRAKEVIVRVDTKAFGGVKSVKLLPDNTPLETRLREDWMQFTMPLDPLGTVLLETKR